MGELETILVPVHPWDSSIQELQDGHHGDHVTFEHEGSAGVAGLLLCEALTIVVGDYRSCPVSWNPAEAMQPASSLDMYWMLIFAAVQVGM